MEGYSPQVRADRVIGVSRLLLAAVSILALVLDPDLVPVPLRAPMLVLTVYAAYAAALLVMPRAMRFESRSLRLALLLVDFIVFSAIVALTHGAGSPFFVFFVFSIFCAVLRLGARGAIATAAVAGIVYLIIAAAEQTLRTDPGYVVLRIAYLAVITLFLTHLARYQERGSAELLAIASWRRDVPAQLDTLLSENLRAAATLLRAPRALCILEDSEEPWITVTELANGRLTTGRLSPDSLEPLVAEELSGTTFFAAHGRLVIRDQSGIRTAPDTLFSSTARDLFDLGAALSASLDGDTLSGWIFFTGRRDWSSDDLALAGIASRLFSAQIDQFGVQEQMRRAAVGDERMRVARDLHDGLLQSLTGAALQIQTLLQATTDDALRTRLAAVQDIIATDQRELRTFVSQLRPGRIRSIDVPLAIRLHSLAERFTRQWNIDVEVVLHPPSPVLPAFVASEIYSLVNESLANAAKHAQASRIRAEVVVDAGEVRLTVEDDGHGFPFTGTYDLDRLDAERRGPVTLKERVASLGGAMTLESTAGGSKIEIRIEL